MKFISFVSRYMSRVLFAVVYVLDILISYYAYGPETALLVSLGIFFGISLQSLLALAFLRAHSLKNSESDKAALLEQCMEEVISQYGKNRKVKLYISDDNSPNAYTVGYSIVVSRGLLDTRNTSMIKALLSHSYSHILNCDSIFAALVQLNSIFVTLFVGISFLSLSMGVVIFGFIIITAICSGFWGIFFGRHLKDGMQFLRRNTFKAVCFILNFISVMLTRMQESEADRFCVRLGLSNGLKDYLEQFQNVPVGNPKAEFLLGVHHDSVLRRIVKIEKAENFYGQNQNTSYQNIFI